MIRWLKGLSLELKILLGLAVTVGPLALGCIALLIGSFGPSTREELTRSRSPDGALEAISTRYDVGGGATVGFWAEVFIQEAGSPPLTDPGRVRGQIFESDLADITQLAWQGPNKLIISAETSRYFRNDVPKKVEISYGDKVRSIEIELRLKLYPQDQGATAVPAAP